MGQVLPVEVPSTAEEFDQLAGRTGACVDEASKNVIYRSWNHDFREAFCEALEAETGEPRKSHEEGEGDKKKVVYDEKEAPYYNRLIADKHITEEAAQSIANTVAAGIKFDPTPAKRGGKAPKELVLLVDNAFTAIESAEHPLTAEKFAANLAGRLGIDDFDSQFGELTKESAVAALVAIKDKEARDREAGLLS